MPGRVAPGEATLGEVALGRAPLGPAVSGRSVSRPAVSGTALPGPTVSDTAVSGPSASGTALPGATVSATAVSGPATSGAAVSGPTVSATVSGSATSGAALPGEADSGEAAPGPAAPGPGSSNSAAPRGEPAVDMLSDEQLLAGLARCAEERRRIDARSALISAEIARRSRRELGHSGLAQRAGARTGEELIQRVSGQSGRDARTLVQVGTLLAAPSPDEPARPWLRAVADAVRGGELGVEAAHAIRSGLGDPSPTVASEALGEAAERLVARAREIGADRLAEFARHERDAIDEAGVAQR